MHLSKSIQFKYILIPRIVCLYSQSPALYNQPYIYSQFPLLSSSFFSPYTHSIHRYSASQTKTAAEEADLWHCILRHCDVATLVSLARSGNIMNFPDHLTPAMIRKHFSTSFPWLPMRKFAKTRFYLFLYFLLVHIKESGQMRLDNLLPLLSKSYIPSLSSTSRLNTYSLSSVLIESVSLIIWSRFVSL